MNTAAPTPVIVVLAKAFPPVVGGVETYSEQVARAYRRAGWPVVVLTQTDGPRGWRDSETPDGSIRLWNAGTGNQVTVFRRMIAEAMRVRRTTRIAAVHATTWRVGVVGQAVFRSVARVVTVHGREVLNYPRGAGCIMRWVLRHASIVLCVSEATRAVALDASRARETSAWVVAHNGLTDADRAAHAGRKERVERDGGLRVLSLCRLVPRKNIATAVEAVASLEPPIRDRIEFRIAGRGPAAPAVQRAIDAGSVGDVVALMGYVPEEDVPALYDWADVFVHPHSHVGEGSDFEGFGIAIADAMAHGCAVISGRDGGPQDFIVDGETGLLVDGNSSTSVASALRRYAVDSDFRRIVAGNGREFARKHFSWDRHVAPVVSAIHGAELSE